MADTLDLLTLEEGKNAVNFDPSADAGQTAELEHWITAASRRIDGLCGPVVKRTITGELHDGGGSILIPKFWPVLSVTTLTEYSGTTAQVLTAQTNTAQTANDYWLDPRTGIIGRQASGSISRFPAGLGNVLLTYVAGRVNDTASVDPLFKEGCAILLAHLWANSGAGRSANRNYDAFDGTNLVGTAPFATPNAVRDLLTDELRPPAVA